MLNRFSYRQKWHMLLTGCIFLYVIAWKLSFHETLKVWRDVSISKQRLALASNAPARNKQLEQDLHQLDLLTGNKPRGGDTRQMLLSHLSTLCNKYNVSLVNMGEPVYNSNAGYVVVLHQIRMSGGYLDLVRSLNELESCFTEGKVASAQFYTRKNLITKKAILYLEVWLQIIHVESEN
jgi:hypothetical protein